MLMRLTMLALLSLGGIAVSALPVRKDVREIVFGDKNLSVVFDARTGAMKKLSADGRPVLECDPPRIPFDLVLENGRRLSDAGPGSFRLENVRQTADDTLELTVKAGDFSVVGRYRLFPESRMLNSSYEVSGPTDRTVNVYGFRAFLPQAVFSPMGYYACPGLFPRTGKRFLRDLSAGRTVRNWRDPCPTIVQLDRGRTLLTLQDRTRSYSDIGATEITEQSGGVSLAQVAESCGSLRPGKPWTIGDFYCWVQNNGGDAALLRIHEWMKQIGMTVPADRDADCKNTILYSFHPGMPGHPLQDWGGFVPSTAQLPRIRRLNCNTVWILPVESECPYIPDDYYRMAPGIGTPEEYGKLVGTAHGLGMKVWQDVVPHGGRSSCRRALEHPDWLLRDETGKVPRVRCFDYANPDWQKYLGEVVRFYTRTYGLDGWRIDTAGFSAQPNWSRTIPYGRASGAMGQGGLGMMRALRNGAREANPRAVTLAESDGSVYGVAADAVYDFPLCRQVFKSILELPPDRFVAELTAWLHEQKYAELEDLIRLRYIESHDEPRAESLYGPRAMRAGVALTAWIDGIPMLYKEMEDGHSAVFRRIFRLREACPELARGDAVYPGCSATPGVFACLRRDAEHLSIPLINFNPVPVKARISIPAGNVPEKLRNSASAAELWNGTAVPLVRRDGGLCAEVDLPAYGFTVLRPGEPAAVPPETPAPAGGGAFPAEAFLLNENGERRKLDFNPDPETRMFRSPLSGDNALMFRIPLDGEPATWRVRSGSGTTEDLFRTRHPFYNSKLNNMYSLPSGHNVLYSSLSQPFGFDEKNAEISLFTAKRSIRFSFPPEDRPGAVFLLDRVGGDHNPWLVIVKRVPDTPLAAAGNRVAVRISRDVPDRPEPAGTGDSRLTAIAGGWLFDNGAIRLRIASNGSLAGWWTREADGSWRPRLSDLRVDLESGYAGGGRQFTSAREMEAFSTLEKRPDGTLELRFFGRPRGRHFYDILAPNMLNYMTAYTLDDSASFGFSCGVRPVAEVPGSRMRLGFSAGFPAPPILVMKNPGAFSLKSAGGNLEFSRIVTRGGAPEQIGIEKNRLVVDWYRERLPGCDFGVWRTFSAVIGAGKDSGGPEPLREVPGRPASVAAGELLDPSFEFDYWGAFPDTVQMFAYALPWQMPFGSFVAADSSRRGARAAGIAFGATKEEQRIRQRLAGKTMHPGETWRLSAMVKAENLKFAGSRTVDLRLTSRSRSAAIPLPGGSYDYRKFSVDFTVPPDWSAPEIQIGGKAESGTIRIDDICLEKISGPVDSKEK